jgi:hypothetical protein
VRLITAERTGSPELRVANTGAPLDADGVAALASLRASAKRDSDAVGRFGVGFAAVLGVSTEPRVVSTTGGVVFSAARTAAEVAALGGVAAEELHRRGGRPPVLRLCWPTAVDEPPPPAGYHTEVRLPLGEEVDAADLLAVADADAAGLLLALPWLVEIVVAPSLDGARVDTERPDREPSVHRRDDHPDGSVSLHPGPAHWRLVRRAGRWTTNAGQTGVRATEERADWAVCWALPVDVDGRPRPLGADVLHAPTPTDERLSLPARLLAALPMQPTRRRIRTGPDTDAVLAEAASAYRDLVLALPPGDRVALVPEPGFPRSELDGALRAAIRRELADTAWLPTAAGREVRPSDAVLLELPAPTPAELTELLADVIPGLLTVEVARAPRAVLAELGVPRLSLAALADRLAQPRRAPDWWRRLYTALAAATDSSPTARDELAALPVPLVDGRTVTGPRTTVTLVGAADPPGAPGGPGDALVDALAGLELPGLRIVHPEAVHPLLHRLGAAEAGPAELLDHSSVAEAVDHSVEQAEDGLDTGPLARLVLGLLGEIVTDRHAGPEALAARPWLAGLALPDTEGEPRRADELMLPDAALRPLLVPDAPIGVLAAELADAYPRPVLTSAGVLDAFALVVDEHPAGPDHDLADEETWWDTLDEPPRRLVALRDLDLVDDAAWPAALALLARLAAERPAFRSALHEPAGYTTWWLARNARLAGHPPRHWRLPSATSLAGLYDEPPPEVLHGGKRSTPNERSAPDERSAMGEGSAPGAGSAPDERSALGEGSVPGGGSTLPDELLAAIGVRADLAVRDAADAADLLTRLGDPNRRPDAALTWRAHAELAEAVLAGRLDPADLDPPRRVRASDGSVVASDRAVLLDRPWLAPALPAGETVAARSDPDGVDALAELLDLPLASEMVAGRALADASARECRWTDLAEVVAACAAAGAPVPEGVLQVCERLTVELTRPESRRLDVPVWREDGRWLAADPVRALLALWATVGP